MNFCQFIDEMNSKAGIVTQISCDMKNSEDFMIVGYISKIVKPSYDKIKGNFITAQLFTRKIILINLVDSQGSKTSKTCKVIVILSSHTTTPWNVEINDVIAMKNPRCTSIKFSDVPTIITHQNYWIYKNRDLEEPPPVEESPAEAVEIPPTTVQDEAPPGDMKASKGTAKQEERLPVEDSLAETVEMLPTAVQDEAPPGDIKASKRREEQPFLSEGEPMKKHFRCSVIPNENHLPEPQLTLIRDEALTCLPNVNVGSTLVFSAECVSDKSINSSETCNKICTFNTQEKCPVSSKIYQETNNDNVLDLILLNSLNDKNYKTEFFSRGCFSDATISYLVSDDITLGYCEGKCKNLFSYHHFCWEKSTDQAINTAYCPACDSSCMLRVFFYCPLKLETESHPISLYFYSEDDKNFFGIHPLEYAYSNEIRSKFRIKTFNDLKVNNKFVAIDFYEIGNQIIPFFQNIVEQETL